MIAQLETFYSKVCITLIHSQIAHVGIPEFFAMLLRIGRLLRLTKTIYSLYFLFLYIS